MKIFVSLASVLACACSSTAQITATLNHSPHGSEITIGNEAMLPLTGVAVSLRWKMDARLSQALRGFHPTEAPARLYLDSTVDASAQPLPPNQEHTWEPGSLVFHGLPLLDPRIAIEEPIVTAGIFADGSTTGDPGLLDAVINAP